MAMIGHIKEVSIEDGQITAVVETGNGPAVTTKVMSSSGSEFYPQRGDTVLFHKAGQEVIVSAVLHGDANTESGESLVFSRDADGNVVSSIHFKVDGTITMTPTKVVEVGNGTSPVSLAQKVDLLWNTLMNACNTWAAGAPKTPDGGVALASAISGAIQGVGIDTGSTNLKAD